MEERYSTGIWYDVSGGEYVRLEEGDGCVKLLNPDSGEVYHKIDAEDWEASEKYDFLRVPDKAVENPVEYMSEKISEMQSEMMESDIGMLYADMNTKLVER